MPRTPSSAAPRFDIRPYRLGVYLWTIQFVLVLVEHSRRRRRTIRRVFGSVGQACAESVHDLGIWTTVVAGEPPVTNRTRRTRPISLAAVIVKSVARRKEWHRRKVGAIAADVSGQ